MDAAGNDVYRLSATGQSQRIVATGLFAQADEVFVGGGKYQTAVMDETVVFCSRLLQLGSTETQAAFAAITQTFQRCAVGNFCQDFGIQIGAFA